MLQQRLPLAVLKLLRCQLLRVSMVALQQRLPLAVLKLMCSSNSFFGRAAMLQQRLPLAVLKRVWSFATNAPLLAVATALTACGIETAEDSRKCRKFLLITLQQRLPLAVLKRYK